MSQSGNAENLNSDGAALGAGAVGAADGAGGADDGATVGALVFGALDDTEAMHDSVDPRHWHAADVWHSP